MTRFPAGCFFLEQHPEDLCGCRERELQTALRDIGYISGVVCWQAVEGVFHILLDGKPFGDYDALEHQWVKGT